MFIPIIPVIHRPSPRFSAWTDSQFGANVLLSQGSGLPETERRSQQRPGGDRGSSKEPRLSKQGPGNRKEEARGSGASQSRTHFPSRVRRNLKPPGGGNRERTSEKLRFIEVRQGTFNSKPQGREGRYPPGNRRPAARQGSEPAGTGTGSAMNRRKEPEGPTGAARPRPEPPWERRLRLHGQANGPRDSGGRQQCRPPFRFGAGRGLSFQRHASEGWHPGG
jgi:hypothetical protein